MFELIIFILFIFCFLFLLFNNVSIRQNNSKMLYELLKSKANVKLLEKQIEVLENMVDGNLQQDSFFKFVSDSRDVAFTYIEDMQKELIKFDNDMRLKIAENNIVGIDKDYKDKYTDLATTLFSELDKIKEFLPKETDNGR
jgi:hypothetical protein